MGNVGGKLGAGLGFVAGGGIGSVAGAFIGENQYNKAKDKATSDAANADIAARQALEGKIGSSDLDAQSKAELEKQARTLNGDQSGFAISNDQLTGLLTDATKYAPGSIYAARKIQNEQARIIQDRPGQSQTLLAGATSSLLTGNS